MIKNVQKPGDLNVQDKHKNQEARQRAKNGQDKATIQKNTEKKNTAHLHACR